MRIATLVTLAASFARGLPLGQDGEGSDGAVVQLYRRISNNIIEAGNGPDKIERNVTVAHYDFFTVDPEDSPGNSCLGFQGLVTLYQGGSFTLKWSNIFFSTNKYSPTLLSLYLTTDPTNATITHDTFVLVQNASVDARSSAVSISLPLDKAPPIGKYWLTGNFYDSVSQTLVTMHDPTNATTDNHNVYVKLSNDTCDLQQPASVPINVPLAAGLGGGTSLFLIVFTVVTVYRSRLLQKRDQKGKYWMDGPRSKSLQKDNFFDAGLNRIRGFVQARKAKKAKASDDDDDDSSSEEEDDSSTDGMFPMETLVASNPFISEEDKASAENSTGKHPTSFDSAAPLKDESSNEISAAAAAVTKKSKGKQKKNAVNPAEKDDGSDKASPPVLHNNSNVVRDPVTGQLRTFVFIDSRGPPARNTGGSSRWTPPDHVLHVRHRVLTSFTASHPDELTLMRGNLVVVEYVFEDGWAVVYKIDDPHAPKAEAVNKGKKGDLKLVTKMASAPLIGTTPDALSWGKRVLGLAKDEALDDFGPLGDAATGGRMGIVPYNILFSWPEPFGARKPLIEKN
ncbi:hypothetical protein BC830DRAFT_1088768 [Chytriomyces sp. MP71]|nr:hypothetical protein BC830DRAFT_1088768 [Chytriomyces sp. MP71]